MRWREGGDKGRVVQMNAEGYDKVDRSWTLLEKRVSRSWIRKIGGVHLLS
jgi:hypothetical protein